MEQRQQPLRRRLVRADQHRRDDRRPDRLADRRQLQLVRHRGRAERRHQPGAGRVGDLHRGRRRESRRLQDRLVPRRRSRPASRSAPTAARGIGLSTGGDAGQHLRRRRHHGHRASPSAPSTDRPDLRQHRGARQRRPLPPPPISTLERRRRQRRLHGRRHETGSPGARRCRRRWPITEVAPWGSGNAAYGADWWELTNTGDAPIDLTGWKIDDNSNSVRQRCRAERRDQRSPRASRRSSSRATPTQGRGVHDLLVRHQRPGRLPDRQLQRLRASASAAAATR